MRIQQYQSRLDYLDSVRGIAALQVLMLHLLSAFFPNFVNALPASNTVGGYVHASPLFILYDGSSAVYIFFTLSGYVLTSAFSRSNSSLQVLIGSRFCRLAIPSVACCAFSAIIFYFLAGYNDIASTFVNGSNLSHNWHPDATLWFLKDGVINAVLLGYRGYGVVEWLGLSSSHLDALVDAYAAPLWTISIEFYGSILVLMLTRYVDTQKILHIIFSVLIILIFCRSAMICLVIGHMASSFRLAESRMHKSIYAPLLMIVAGLSVCIVSQFWQPPFLTSFCDISGQILVPCFFHAPAFLMRMYGAIILTIGIMQFQPLHRLLSHKRASSLGRLSFPIYLAHWPIIFGVSSFILVKTISLFGSVPARMIALISGLIITFVMAEVFYYVDRFALRAARFCRKNHETDQKSMQI